MPEEKLNHKWDMDEEDCPITFGTGKSHGKHFFKCSICELRRLAHSEHGNYHYFTYEKDGVMSEVEPPCTSTT